MNIIKRLEKEKLGFKDLHLMVPKDLRQNSGEKQMSSSQRASQRKQIPWEKNN